MSAFNLQLTKILLHHLVMRRSWSTNANLTFKIRRMRMQIKAFILSVGMLMHWFRSIKWL